MIFLRRLLFRFKNKFSSAYKLKSCCHCGNVLYHNQWNLVFNSITNIFSDYDILGTNEYIRINTISTIDNCKNIIYHYTQNVNRNGVTRCTNIQKEIVFKELIK